MNDFIQIISRFFAQVIYIQLSPERLTIRNPKSGVTVSELPEIAIVRKPKASVLAVGAKAGEHKFSPGVEISNPFAHPRSMMSDFTLGEITLKAFLARVRPDGLFTLAPKVIVHPLGDSAGGLTPIEIRAFREMALGSGASQAIIWQGPALTDEELLSGRFPESGQILS